MGDEQVKKFEPEPQAGDNSRTAESLDEVAKGNEIRKLTGHKYVKDLEGHVGELHESAFLYQLRY